MAKKTTQTKTKSAAKSKSTKAAQRSADLQERLDQYVDKSKIDQLIKEGAARFHAGKNIGEKLKNINKFFDKPHPRYFYVPGTGWYDLKHAASAYAIAEERVKVLGQNVKKGGWPAYFFGDLAEVWEFFAPVMWSLKPAQKARNWQSAFQVEDFRSNQLGIMMSESGKGTVKGIILTNTIPSRALIGQKAEAKLMNTEGKLPDVLLRTLGDILNNFTKQIAASGIVACMDSGQGNVATLGVSAQIAPSSSQ